MNLHFTGGTPQQQRWVRDAVAQCSFPLDKLNVGIEVTWGSPQGPVDTRHPYMVTEVVDTGNFRIVIEPRADDPKDPNTRGLPNPEEDIYDFYKQSVVHEFGHVVTDATFNPGGLDTDPRVAQMCALFWRPVVNSGSGRRFGTIDDWDADPLAWSDEIREAVAEVFKCAFYTGRLIFTNRTNWRLDEESWADFLGFFAIKSGVHGSATAFTSVKVVEVTTQPGEFVDPPFGIIKLALDLQGVDDVPHMTVRGSFGNDTGVSVSVGVLDGNDAIAEVAGLSPPFWLHLSADLTDPANPKASGKVTSDAAGNSVIWSATWPFATAPASGIGAALFTSNIRLAEPSPDHNRLTALADWRFSASQSPPNFVNEQFGQASDISLYDIAQNDFFNELFPPVTGPAVWDGTLHFLSDSPSNIARGFSILDLRSFVPRGEEALTPTATFPFAGPGVAAPGALAHGLIRIGSVS